ncbi:hypothetical protein KAT08_00455 [Candidatus Babeliales bacterium]|nr:hypothetical protein [Candidatus Babeliales bacterium]
MENNEVCKKGKHSILPGIILIVIGFSIFWPDLFSTLIFKLIISLALIWAGLKLIFNKY